MNDYAGSRGTIPNIGLIYSHKSAMRTAYSVPRSAIKPLAAPIQELPGVRREAMPHHPFSNPVHARLASAASCL